MGGWAPVGLYLWVLCGEACREEALAQGTSPVSVTRSSLARAAWGMQTLSVELASQMNVLGVGCAPDCSVLRPEAALLSCPCPRCPGQAHRPCAAASQGSPPGMSALPGTCMVSPFTKDSPGSPSNHRQAPLPPR